jgi:hypothetical protein
LAERDALAEKVKSLEEDLRKQELAMTLGERNIEEMQPPSLPEVTRPGGARGQTIPEARGQVRPPLTDEGPLTSLPEAGPSDEMERKPGDALSGPLVAQPPPGSRTPSGPLAPRPQPSLPVAVAPQESEAPHSGPAPVNFNAQEVTAVSNTGNSGTLSFRLVKDQPNVRFSGYLFVFVEMADKRGEHKIYAYPKRTRLGEEDLPTDYRSGESITFKYNSRVELPYRDIRPGAALAKVSILLYGEDGNIVFQRGFDQKELKMVGAGATKVDGVRPKPEKKRQAL